jgi:hypothetical protein
LVLRAEAVLYFDERIDITPLVIKALDRAERASEPFKPAPAPTPARESQ